VGGWRNHAELQKLQHRGSRERKQDSDRKKDKNTKNENNERSGGDTQTRSFHLLMKRAMRVLLCGVQ
jgi:hypothetical protein